MAFRKNVLTSLDFNPSQFGNWILVDKIDVVNGIITRNYDWDGDVDDKILIKSSLSYGGTGTSAQVMMRFNDDVTATNYPIGYITQDGNVISGNYSTPNNIGIAIGYADVNTVYDQYIEGNLKNLGSPRKFDCRTEKYIASNLDSLVNYASAKWNNVANKITKISFVTVQSNGGTLTGWIEFYKWVPTRPLEFHTYEVIKEFNLSNQALDTTLTIDGETDSVLFIEANLVTNTYNSDLLLCLNSDNASNYDNSKVELDGSSLTGSYTTSQTGLSIGILGANTSCFSTSLINLKKGKYRQLIGQNVISITSNTDKLFSDSKQVWKNSVAAVTGARLFTTSLVTGTITVKRLVKSHLISSAPGLLCGMWQKYVDANTIQIQPGEIEIAGVNCYVTKQTNLTLSGNLRSGETEGSSKYYYLYAVKDNNRNVSFKFSSIAPTMDRFGNSVASFNDCDMKQDWYHPGEGNTWRYIGQIYNDASSNILPFDKCKPGYWESSWTSIPGTVTQTLPHAFGKIPFNTIDLFASTAVTGTNPHKIPSYFVSTSSQGIGAMITYNTALSTTTLTVNFGAGGIFNNGSWQTTGYYKLIIKD